MKFHLYGIGMWFALSVFMVLNGTLRVYTYEKLIGDLPGHIVSTVTGCALILILTSLFLRFVPAEYTQKDLLVLGVLWLLMTVVFEFLFGHYVAGHPWERLLADYNILKGRIWVLALITTLCAPLIAGRLFGK